MDAAIKAGQIDAAVRAAESLSPVPEHRAFVRVWALTDVALAAIAFGNIETAFQVAKEIPSPYALVEIYTAIMKSNYASALQFKTACQLAWRGAISTDAEDARASNAKFAALANAYAVVGDFDLAWLAASKGGVEAHMSVVTAAQQTNRLDLALDSARRKTSHDSRDRIFAMISHAAAKDGKHVTASAAFESMAITPSPERSKAASILAIALARAGRFYESRFLCDSCEPVDRLEAYTVILTESTKPH